MDKIDAALKPFLQKDVMFTFKHKNYKKGKLLLYKLSSNYLSFTVVTEKKRETFEIPYPFSVKTTETTVLFDYTLESLSEKDFLETGVLNNPFQYEIIEDDLED